MSAQHSYQFSAAAQQRAHAEAMAQQRRIELQRLRLEQAMHVQARTRAAQRAASGLARDNARTAAQAQSQLGSAQRAASRQRSQLGEMKGQTRRLRSGLKEHEHQLAQTKTEIARIRADLDRQIAAARAMHVETDRERSLLQAAIGQAHASIERCDELVGAGEAATAALGQADAAGRDLADAAEDFTSRIAELERELTFIDCHERTLPAAMAVLAGMTASGYRLRETLTRGELTAYFAKADGDHQIAVRVVPERRPGEQTERWEVLAETFGMVGQECVDELDDFDSAMEEIDLGELISKGPLCNYPKAERTGEPERPGTLPAPQAAMRHSGTTRTPGKLRT
jgi:hypothetical protein